MFLYFKKGVSLFPIRFSVNKDEDEDLSTKIRITLARGVSVIKLSTGFMQENVRN